MWTGRASAFLQSEVNPQEFLGGHSLSRVLVLSGFRMFPDTYIQCKEFGTRTWFSGDVWVFNHIIPKLVPAANIPPMSGLHLFDPADPH